MKQYMLIVVFLSAVSGIASAVNPEVTLQVSGAVQGTIVLELYPDKAPITVANFLGYVKSGFYDGLIFHRVMPGFMIQGGGYSPALVKRRPGQPYSMKAPIGLPICEEQLRWRGLLILTQPQQNFLSIMWTTQT